MTLKINNSLDGNDNLNGAIHARNHPYLLTESIGKTRRLDCYLGSLLVNLDHFEVLRAIGKGAFGKVQP
ncbi:hypothetical protein TrispH2_006594 [Trichoplax sp. H2]|nr:hypothetical protein TrispH2_006594 [Trichoplax sp. H2]|eukprot:RDD42714.1 hypothetical protein TrispH2_006594 [Trichoplax sp. H2]